MEKRIPKRRFKEFIGSGDWEEKKLGEVVEYIIDNRGKNPRYMHSGDIPVIDNYMIKNKLYPNLEECSRFIDQETYKNFIRKYSLKDDILITLVGNGIGNITLCPNNKCVIVQNTLGLRVSAVKEFIFYTLIFNNKNILLLDRGMAQPSIRQDELLDFNILIPSISEQEKIGDFFQKLDRLIDINKDKLAKLKASKSAYLTEMFPAEGEDKPKRRFQGFTEPWQEKKLGEVGSVAMNKRIFKHQTKGQGDIPFYKIGTFGKNPDAFISRKLFEKYKEKYSYPKKGDILISASGSIGRTVVYEGKDEYFQDSNIVWLKHEGNINNSFLKQFYKIVKWEGLEGSTIKRLYNKNILETKIKLPSLAEQEKIGDFFKKLDEQIGLQEEKLEKLEKMKKAYLAEMFV